MSLLASKTLSGRTILLIISGGIAAYKSLELIRRLRDRGARVRCILTSGGARFITPLSVGALSEEKVYTDLFSLTDEQEMGHIRLARETDLVLVSPASANMIARAAHGIADDLASTVLLATDKPVMFVPAMNPVMWQNKATQENLATLLKRGIHVLDPASGDMACGENGQGRLPEVQDIIAAVNTLLEKTGPLKGLHALVTAGPTFEPLDPVRFIGNHSSGKQGYAIAAALARQGANVTLVSGPVSLAPPDGVDVRKVTTADEMLAASLAALPADIAVCTAAVADYKPETAAGGKIKKADGAGLTLHLVQNPDILATLCCHEKRPKLVIGFAAETDADEDKAFAKLERKNCDWLLLNDVSNGRVFGMDTNKVTVIRKDDAGKKNIDTWPEMPKDDIARRLADDIAKKFS